MFDLDHLEGVPGRLQFVAVGAGAVFVVALGISLARRRGSVPLVELAVDAGSDPTPAK